MHSATSFKRALNSKCDPLCSSLTASALGSSEFFPGKSDRNQSSFAWKEDGESLLLTGNGFPETNPAVTKQSARSFHMMIVFSFTVEVIKLIIL